jgi:hypothetical protein
MNDNRTQSIRESYDRLADEYARRIFNELTPAICAMLAQASSV